MLNDNLGWHDVSSQPGEKDPLIGKRFKCTTCRDYDLCETCHNNRHAIHPEHSFYRMPAPFSLELSVVCDGCGKKKIQPEDRFKCTECPDYDLCASCFDDCSRIHPHHSTWEHQGQKVCIASAPPAEPEPETVLNEDRDFFRKREKDQIGFVFRLRSARGFWCKPLVY